MLHVLLNEANWSRVNEDDSLLYDSYFAQSHDNWAYENSWGFITQETRNGAIKYQDSDTLLTVVSKNPTSCFLFAFISFMNFSNSCNILSNIAHQLLNKTEKIVIFRKVQGELCKILLSSDHFTVVSHDIFDHINEIPEDIYPQVIIDLEKATLLKGTKWMQIRNHLNFFNNTFKPVTADLSVRNLEDALQAIQSWSNEYILRVQTKTPELLLSTQSVIDPTAYTVFAQKFARKIDNKNFFSKIIYIDKKPVSFSLAGRVSQNCAALYSSIQSTSHRGCSEYSLYQLFHQMIASKVSFLNLGGAETEGLHMFKRKFQPLLLRTTYDVMFKPN